MFEFKDLNKKFIFQAKFWVDFIILTRDSHNNKMADGMKLDFNQLNSVECVGIFFFGKFILFILVIQTLAVVLSFHDSIFSLNYQQEFYFYLFLLGPIKEYKAKFDRIKINFNFGIGIYDVQSLNTNFLIE